MGRVPKQDPEERWPYLSVLDLWNHICRSTSSQFQHMAIVERINNGSTHETTWMNMVHGGWRTHFLVIHNPDICLRIPICEIILSLIIILATCWITKKLLCLIQLILIFISDEQLSNLLSTMRYSQLDWSFVANMTTFSLIYIRFNSLVYINLTN